MCLITLLVRHPHQQDLRTAPECLAVQNVGVPTESDGKGAGGLAWGQSQLWDLDGGPWILCRYLSHLITAQGLTWPVLGTRLTWSLPMLLWLLWEWKPCSH